MRAAFIALAIAAALTIALAPSRDMPPARPEPFGKSIVDRAFGSTPS